MNAHQSVYNQGRVAALAGLERNPETGGYSTTGKGKGFANSWLKGYDSVPAKKRGSLKDAPQGNAVTAEE